MNATIFGRGLTEAKFEGNFLLMLFYKEAFLFLLPPPFSYSARNRQVGKLDFEQEHKYAQGRE